MSHNELLLLRFHLSSFFFRKIFTAQRKSVKAISHIPVLSLIVEVQSSVLCTATEREEFEFENIDISYALHTCLNKHVM
jgi:hypothetical protein